MVEHQSDAPNWLQCQIGLLPTPKRLIYKYGTPLTPYICNQDTSLSIKRDKKLTSKP